MPELPEVETIRRFLEKKVAGKNIKDIKINFPKIIACPDPQRFIDHIKDRKILSLSRRGKFLIFHLSGGKMLISHLRMTGQWLVSSHYQEDKLTHLIFTLTDSVTLTYRDIRKFGRVWLIEQEDYDGFVPLARLGPEPLTKEFDFENFNTRLMKYKSKIKTVLLNQSCIAGLGNIYADEVLFAAGVNPQRRVQSLKPGEKSKIFQSIKRILAEAIQNKGTTIINFMTPEGKDGSFQKKLKVYGRKGGKCVRCRKTLCKIIVAGRGTCFCGTCQK